jgi:UDPglucose 6-dehydrogenase
VICVDVDAGKIERLNRGEIPIYEPGLEDLVERNRRRAMRFTTDAATAAKAHGEVIFIAVGTPPDEDGSADLRYVLAVAKTIGQHLARRGRRQQVDRAGRHCRPRARAIARASWPPRGEIAFDVVSNPEFLKEGDAVKDCMRPDRIVIGSDSAKRDRGAEAPVRAVQPQP